jgi:Ras-related protein Rab-6A
MNAFTPAPAKVVFVGEAHVGKTSLLQSFLGNTIDPNTYTPTVPAQFHKVKVNIEGENIPLQVWDTAGQEEYSALVPLYARGAQVGIIVAAVDDPHSVAEIGKWKNFLTKGSADISIIVAINKTDLGSLSSEDEARVAVYEPRYYVSALTGEDVGELFREAGRIAKGRRGSSDTQLTAATSTQTCCK